ncbi:hypothetical protein [Streptomyces longwoodensis]|uniref:hypothetical protein n=1 Tax=Streptomyces longwoodensis TaxID=68231 RepID=UPI0036F0BC48
MKRTYVQISARPGKEAREAWRALGRLTENVGAAWVLRPVGTGRTAFSLCFDGDFAQSVWDELAELTPLASKFDIEVRQEPG